MVWGGARGVKRKALDRELCAFASGFANFQAVTA